MGAQGGFNSINQTAKSALGGVSTSLDNTAKRATSFGKAFKGLLGGAAFTTLARDVTRYAQAVAGLVDEYSKIQNQLRLVTTGSENLRVVQAELFTLAQETRSPLEGTALLYARIARNADDLGLSQKEVLGITRTVNKAIQISGGTAQEASAGVIQFAQALASGTLRGDELRSVMENMPRLSRAISEGLGVPIGKLRELSEAGELTAEKVIEALQKSSSGVAEEFEKITPTIGAAFTVLRNSIVDTVGKLNEASGAGKTFAEFVIDAAKVVMQFGQALTGSLQPMDEVSSGMQIIASAVIIAYGAIEAFVTLLKGIFVTTFKSIGQLLGGFAATIVALFSGDFKRAGQIATETMADFDRNLIEGSAKTTDELISDMSRRIESLVELWDKGARDAEAAQAALAGGDMSKKKREQSFDEIAAEIKANSMVWQQSPNALLESQSDFSALETFDKVNKEALKDIEQAATDSWNHIQFVMGQIKDQSNEYAKEAAKNIQGAFADFLFDPFSEGLDGMLKGFLDVIRRMLAEALAAKALQSILGAMNSQGGWMSAAAGALGFTPKAEGGSVQKGVPYTINERAYQKRRPEVFVPNRAGRIMDQSKVDGSQSQAAPTMVFVRSESEIPNAIASRRGKEAIIQQLSTYPDEFRAALGV
jgi:tape measure domain-containing protein